MRTYQWVGRQMLLLLLPGEAYCHVHIFGGPFSHKKAQRSTLKIESSLSFNLQ